MLYVNLTLRNMKRSMKEYSIFLMTMTIAMMLLYAFFAIIYSEDINALLSNSEMIGTSFTMVSVLIVIIMGWLLSYISTFILRKRSKEFGMYSLLGMRQKEIARMFVIEQFCIGLLALFVGCFLGVFMFQLLQAIIMNIFSNTYTLSIQLSWKAFVVTVVCFLAIYMSVLIRESWILRKISIRDLLYTDSKNETIKKKIKLDFLYFFLGIVCVFVGFKLSDTVVSTIGGENARSVSELMLGIILVLCSIYFFFFGISGMLQRFFDHFKSIKYRKFTMILFGKVRGRLHSNRIVLATISMLLLFTFSLLCFGIKFKEITDMTIDNKMPFDVKGVTDNVSNVNKFKEFFDKKDIPMQSVVYKDYRATHLNNKIDETFRKGFKKTPFYSEQQDILYLKYSDYKKLVNLLDYEPMELNDDEFAINVISKEREYLENYMKNRGLKVDDKKLTLKFVDTISIGHNSYYVILPDNLISVNEKEIQPTIQIAGMSEEYLDALLETELLNTLEDENDDSFLNVFQLRTVFIQQSLTSIVSTFSLFYLSFIFVCICATILAVQQMSDVTQQRYEYQLFSDMGLSRHDLKVMLRKQILLYFSVPLIIPVIYVMPTLMIFDKLFELTVAKTSIFVYLGICIPIFLIAYLAYYVLTYLSCKHTLDL